MTHTPNNLIVLRYNGLSLAAAGPTLLFTPGARFMPFMAQIVTRSASGVLSIPATISIGQVSAAYTDILAATALTGVLASNVMLNLPLVLAMGSVAGGTGIYANVSVAVTGITPAQSVDIILLGTSQ